MGNMPTDSWCRSGLPQSERNKYPEQPLSTEPRIFPCDRAVLCGQVEGDRLLGAFAFRFYNDVEFGFTIELDRGNRLECESRNEAYRLIVELFENDERA